VAERYEAGQLSGPATLAGRLKNEASGFFAAHVLRSAGCVNGFTALRTLKAQNVNKFAAGSMQFVGR
jgi:hypothetical protein